MKKFLTFLIIAATTLSLHANSSRDKRFVSRIDTCEAILRELQADPARAIPSDVLQRAKALVITNQIKAGLVLGLQEGYGTILVKKANGEWSIPVVVRAGEGSLGLQLGGSSLETVYVIMS